MLEYPVIFPFKLERFIFNPETLDSNLLADHSVRWDVAARLNRKTAKQNTTKVKI